MSTSRIKLNSFKTKTIQFRVERDQSLPPVAGIIKETTELALATPEGKAALGAAARGLEEVFSTFGFKLKNAEVSASPLANPRTLTDIVKNILPDLLNMQSGQLAGRSTVGPTRQLGAHLTESLNHAGIPGRLNTFELRDAPIGLGGNYFFTTKKTARAEYNVGVLRDPDITIPKFAGFVMHEATHFEQNKFLDHLLAGGSPEDVQRFTELDSSLSRMGEYSDKTRMALDNQHNFRTAVEPIYDNFFEAPNRLLTLDAQRNSQTLKTLVGSRSLPPGLRMWAKNQMPRSQKNMQPLLDFFEKRDKALDDEVDLHLHNYNSLYHEREALMVQHLTEEATTKLLSSR